MSAETSGMAQRRHQRGDRAWTRSGLATYGSAGFRVYPPEEVTDRLGRRLRMRLCEELVGGRWEPFWSVMRIVAEPAAPEEVSDAAQADG